MSKSSYYESHKAQWKEYRKRSQSKASYKVWLKEYMKTYWPKWLAKNREKLRRYKALWHIRKMASLTPEQVEEKRARGRAYFHANAERMTWHTKRRRARLMGAADSHTRVQWLEKIELHAGCCFYCGEQPAELVRDHVTPLVRGGSDGIANILPACRSCNAEKHDKTYDEYIVYRQMKAVA